ncbi:astacin, partial [Teladorsagia circumcincta]
SFQNLIRSAIRHIEHNTCIRFKENGGDRDGLRYFRGNGCWSNVGRTGGRQLISIGYGCDALGIVAHETLHALGLWHEQSRDDRDQFIRVNFARIIRREQRPKGSVQHPGMPSNYSN